MVLSIHTTFVSILTALHTFFRSTISIRMIPVPNSNTTKNTMAYLKYTELARSGSENGQHRETPTSLHHRPSAVQIASLGFMSLAPELRNTIYNMLFESPRCLFVEAAGDIYAKFRLRDSSEVSQYETLHALRVLGSVNREIRFEARTLFYASKHFFILPYGYEYLPIFVRWLEVIGPECRAVLRKVCFAGYLWYQPSITLTQRFQGLLQRCLCLRSLSVQLNVRHLFESSLPDLDAYFNFEGPLPEFDITAWTETIAHFRKIKTFRLDLIMSSDGARTPLKRELMYMYFMNSRGQMLVEHIEERLRGRVNEVQARRDIDVAVRYVGTHERVYYGRLW
jgi:hypothetical protein